MLIVDSKKFRRALIKRGLDIKNLAKEAKIAAYTVAQLKNQNCRVHYSTLHRLLKVLECEPEEILIDDEL